MAISAFWPGMANSRRATRPSHFSPTSITAMSFSMPVTMPFTTLPSKVSFSPPRLSLRRASKSSRVGNAVVAMRCCLSYSNRACRVARHHGGPSPADLVQCTAARGTMPRRRPLGDQRRGAPPMRKSACRCRLSRCTVRARQRDGLPRTAERPPDGARYRLAGGAGQGCFA